MYVPLSYIPLIFHCKLACTTFMVLHTMLVYWNQHFCTCRVHTRIYSLRMAVAGGQLSCSIFTFSCTDIAVHGLTMYSRCHTRMYTFLKKCYRKADHLQQPFSGSIYVYEPCMYRNADSSTLALYVGSWRLYRRVWKILYGCMFVYIRVQTMYIPCTCMACTISLCHEPNIQKWHFMQSSSFEPTIMCIAASCLNHYASSMLACCTIVTVYVYCCSTWLGRLVTRRRTSSTPCPPGCHDVAGPSINMDLFKA
jgi:hypothetical protein